jgi:hypothetical protein
MSHIYYAWPLLPLLLALLHQAGTHFLKSVLIKYFKFEGVFHYVCAQLPPPPSIQGGEFDTLFIYIIQLSCLNMILYF